MKIKIEYAETESQISKLELQTGEDFVLLEGIAPAVHIKLVQDANGNPYIMLSSGEGDEQYRAAPHTYCSTKIEGCRIVIKVLKVEETQWKVTLLGPDGGIWHDFVRAPSIDKACGLARQRNPVFQEVVSARKEDHDFIEQVFVSYSSDIGLGTMIEGVYRDQDRAERAGDWVEAETLHNGS